MGNDALIPFSSANAGVIAQPQPVFVTIPGAMTMTSIMHDVVAFVAQAGSGGRRADILVAPNTLQQYGNAPLRLVDVELDPLVHRRTSRGYPPGQLSQQGPSSQTALSLMRFLVLVWGR